MEFYKRQVSTSLPALRGGESRESGAGEGLLLVIRLIILNQFGQYLFYSTSDDIVGNLVDGSLGIAVYRDDDARILHTSDVLNLT